MGSSHLPSGYDARVFVDVLCLAMKKGESFQPNLGGQNLGPFGVLTLTRIGSFTLSKTL